MELVYPFGPDYDLPNISKNSLGSKGFELVAMYKMGLLVPPGLIISPSYCVTYRTVSELAQRTMINTLLETKVAPILKVLKKRNGYTPLLSVRSGARVSMPGMMDTVLNVGITPKNLKDWQKRIGILPALDSYRRFLEMFGEVVCGIDCKEFAEKFNTKLKIRTKKNYLKLVEQYTEIIASHGHADKISTLKKQLRESINAIFKSWDNPRAIAYRKIHGYSNDWGTAITIQSMVFGNKGKTSCSGVVFTRDPMTGKNVLTGEYLVNAQGEDVVNGKSTPKNIKTLKDWNPKIWAKLLGARKILEDHYMDMQEVEFTVQRGVLYFLQTRLGKRSSRAAFKIAYDLYHSYESITQKDLIKKITPTQFFELLKPCIDPKFTTKPNTTGLAVGGGLVCGHAVFSSKDAENYDGPCILITYETNPEDILGMVAASGILTIAGGVTCHAAVVARGLNKACVVGCGGLQVIKANNGVSGCIGDMYFKTGSLITINGDTGDVWLSVNVPVVSPEVPLEVDALLKIIIGESIEILDSQSYQLKSVRRTCINVQSEQNMLQAINTGIDADREIIFDFRQSPHRNYDRILLDNFSSDDGYTTMINDFQKLCNGLIPKNSTCIVPNDMPSSLQKILMDVFPNYIIEVGSWGALFKSKSTIVLTPEFKQQLGSRKNKTELLSIFKKAGRELVELPAVKNVSTLLFDFLG